MAPPRSTLLKTIHYNTSSNIFITFLVSTVLLVSILTVTHDQLTMHYNDQIPPIDIHPVDRRPAVWVLPAWDDVSNKFVIRNVSVEEIARRLYKISDCSKFMSNGRKNDGVIGSTIYRSAEKPEYLNSGWTKVVHKFVYADGTSVALKSFNSIGTDVKNCYRNSKNNVRHSPPKHKKDDRNQNEANDNNNPDDVIDSINHQNDGDDDYDDIDFDQLNDGDKLMMRSCMMMVRWKLYKEAYLMDLFNHHGVAKLENLCIININKNTSSSSLSPVAASQMPSPPQILPPSSSSSSSSSASSSSTLSSSTSSPSSSSTLIYSTKLGDDASLIKLLQLSWEERLKVCHGLAKLLNYFHQSNNPFQTPVLINDFRRQQFVIVDGDVTISDLDDFTFEDQACQTDKDCSVHGVDLAIECKQNVCENWIDAKNIYNAGTNFINILLLPGSPRYLKTLASEIVAKFQRPINTSSPELLKMMDNLVKVYSDGLYLNRNVGNGGGEKKLSVTKKSPYRVVPGHDLPSYHDYQCKYTRNTFGCTVTVYDVREAEEMCDEEGECVAFVVSPHTSWTGRRYVHLKNNFTREALKRATGGYLTYYKRHATVI